MISAFFDLANELAAGRISGLTPSGIWTLWLEGEESEFARFNHGLVRQAGSVRQANLTLDRVENGRHARATLSLGGTDEDPSRLAKVWSRMDQALPLLPPDPHVLLSEESWECSSQQGEELPPGPEIAQAVVDAAAGADLVGILAAGPVHRAFASSFGHRLCSTRSSLHLDYSVVHEADRAAKGSYAHQTWNPQGLTANIHQTLAQMELLSRPLQTLEPGSYRAYLSPSAVAEILQLLCWGGFGLRDQKTRRSPLARLVDGKASFAPGVHISEHTEAGLAPSFQAQGFARPHRVALVDGGKAVGALVSPRSSREYEVLPNGAGAEESPESLEMSGGKLDTSEAMEALGTGLYVTNLWYLNYSDRPAGRITGMTRFATHWVQDGKAAGPVPVMRFDDTVYDLLGSKLLELTTEQEFLPSSSTYFGRSTDSLRVPGALIDGLALTL